MVTDLHGCDACGMVSTVTMRDHPRERPPVGARTVLARAVCSSRLARCHVSVRQSEGDTCVVKSGEKTVPTPSPLSPRERQLLSALSEGSTRTELAVE